MVIYTSSARTTSSASSRRRPLDIQKKAGSPSPTRDRPVRRIPSQAAGYISLIKVRSPAMMSARVKQRDSRMRLIIRSFAAAPAFAKGFGVAGLLVVLVLPLKAQQRASNDWNQWRGPNRDGSAPA